MTIRPKTLTIKEYFAKANARKQKRAAKALFLWPKQGLGAPPAAPRRPRRVLTPRQRLRARLDALWSLVIRVRGARRTGGMCERCKVREIVVAYHIEQRGDDATRWDLDNGIATCTGCNWWEKNNRGRRVDDEHVRMFGAAFVERLKTKARTIADFSMADLEQIYENLKLELTRFK